MNKWIAIPVISVLAVGIIAGGYFLWQQTSKLEDARSEIVALEEIVATLEGEVTTLEGEVATLEGNVATLETDLNSTKETLASTQTELSSTKKTLNSTQTELNSTKETLVSTQTELGASQAELGSTKQTLASTQQQLTVAQETLGGLGITLYTSKECSDVVLIDNPTATNPTWSQLMAFLTQDLTERHTYIKDVYDCSQFSRDVHNNAEAAGIRAAEIHIDFRNEDVGHALNAFLTSDYGLVYVDCTGGPDTIARIKAGKEYRAVELHRIIGTIIRNDLWWDTLYSYYYIPSSTWGHKVTSSIKIYW